MNFEPGHNIEEVFPGIRHVYLGVFNGFHVYGSVEPVLTRFIEKYTEIPTNVLTITKRQLEDIVGYVLYIRDEMGRKILKRIAVGKNSPVKNDDFVRKIHYHFIERYKKPESLI